MSMVRSSTGQPNDPHLNAEPPIASNSQRLGGKRAAMVMFSVYPGDPRPRRAVEALAGEGMEVDLVCLGSDDAPRNENLDGVRVLRVPLKNRRGGKFAYAFQYAAFILISSFIFALRSLNRRYDLVYVHNMPDILVLSALIPAAFGAKVILDLHDPMPELMVTIFSLRTDSLIVRLITWLEKWSMARADLVLTVNIACKRIFASASQTSNKRFVVMYHGSIVERNGLDLAVDAFARVRESIPAAELRIYGARTAFLDRVMDAAKSKGLDEAIRYLGPKRLEDLVPAIEDCDVGVIPNQRNPFTEINTPTRIFEYLALGKPVVAPYTPGVKDYFSDESLLFFESGNSEELARKIEYVFAHAKEANEIAERGQQIYLRHIWSQERKTLVGMVSEVLKGNKNAVELCST